MLGAEVLNALTPRSEAGGDLEQGRAVQQLWVFLGVGRQCLVLS